MEEDRVTISIRTSDFDKLKKKAIKSGDEYCDDGEEGKEMNLNYLKLDSKSDERYFDVKSNSFVFSGSLVDIDTEENLGYLSMDVKLDSEMLLDIISMYIKRLSKVKTVIEAIKDE